MSYIHTIYVVDFKEFSTELVLDDFHENLDFVPDLSDDVALLKYL